MRELGSESVQGAGPGRTDSYYGEMRDGLCAWKSPTLRESSQDASALDEKLELMLRIEGNLKSP